MRDWLKQVCSLIFGTAGVVVNLVDSVANALHTVPCSAAELALEKGDEIVCDAIDGLFDAVKGVKEATPE